MKRSRLETIIDILNATKTPILGTHIMYKANVNMDASKPIVEMLIRKGLVMRTPVKGTKRLGYILTDKGRETLKATTVIAQLMAKDAPHSLALSSGCHIPSPVYSRKHTGATETCPRQ